MTPASILALILSNPQAIQSTVDGLVHMFKATTAVAPVQVPVGSTAGAVARAPSDTIKAVQKLLNQIVKPQPPLQEDGWLGPRTEKAIRDGLAMAQPYITMLG
jgi:lysozyme family protein